MAISYDQFVAKYNGRFVDYDHAYGAQCVDLMRQYCQDVFGVNGYTAIPPRGSAKNIYTAFVNNQYFTKIANTPTGVPLRGDILFFKTSVTPAWSFGSDGHVGIVDGADVNTMFLFNQNYPTGSVCKFTKFSYKDCQGWLRPKKKEVIEQAPTEPQEMEDTAPSEDPTPPEIVTDSSVPGVDDPVPVDPTPDPDPSSPVDDIPSLGDSVPPESEEVVETVPEAPLVQLNPLRALVDALVTLFNRLFGRR